MEKLVEVSEFKEVFNNSYGHIYLDDSHNKILKIYVDRINNDDLSYERALDMCQDNIMSQGLADYQE